MPTLRPFRDYPDNTLTGGTPAGQISAVVSRPPRLTQRQRRAAMRRAAAMTQAAVAATPAPPPPPLGRVVQAQTIDISPKKKKEPKRILHAWYAYHWVTFCGQNTNVKREIYTTGDFKEVTCKSCKKVIKDDLKRALTFS